MDDEVLGQENQQAAGKPVLLFATFVTVYSSIFNKNKLIRPSLLGICSIPNRGKASTCHTKAKKDKERGQEGRHEPYVCLRRVGGSEGKGVKSLSTLAKEPWPSPNILVRGAVVL
jgi:hypothetical protein